MNNPSARLKAGPVDMHSHMTPHDFPAGPAGEARWPCMQHTSATTATVMMGDKPFRQLDNRSWDRRKRIEDMDRDGVSVHALSPMPELLSYWFGPDAATAMCDLMNQDIADHCAAEPSRFAGLGMVPMQDPALAVKHLERVKNVYGLSGIEVGSNVNGKYLGDRSFDPVWEAAESLGLAVYAHALHPLVTQGLDLPMVLTNTAGFPIDTAMTVASMLANDTIGRFPNLRIGFSHGGGAVAPIVYRLDWLWNLGGDMAGSMPNRPRDMAAKMYFDSNVYDTTYLKHLCEHLAPGHIFLGTDYPYVIEQTDPVGYAKRANLNNDQLDSLLFGAAHKFLRHHH
ncbi:amidohydrolase family protein [Phenylobacterium sp.]|uniref:amidohydrolase family protein n=1 Tax=Phenylobacterium sp. TaxID=1871053 RepID=UPI002737499A|nr:amidohydrolase family protein [Phenylobacterium sp.]MDP3658613.1 amidohydrolase family protein [Phenylobacterium sp.]